MRLQFRPEGDTLSVSETVPVNPLTGVTVMVDVPVAPTAIDTVEGPAAMLKSCIE